MKSEHATSRLVNELVACTISALHRGCHLVILPRAVAGQNVRRVGAVTKPSERSPNLWTSLFPK